MEADHILGFKNDDFGMVGKSRGGRQAGNPGTDNQDVGGVRQRAASLSCTTLPP
jgi:hypothetical protein